MSAAAPDAITIELATAAETAALGARIGAALRGGELIALLGPLGAGKTTLTAGLARGLGVAADEPIASPTFVLAREHAGRLRLIHVDAYRLADADELFLIGFEELRNDQTAAIVVEWADRVSELTADADLQIALAVNADGSRSARLRGDVRLISAATQ